MATLFSISLLCLIQNVLSCTYVAQTSPIPPFDEVARIPLGVCTGNHYFHSKIAQESVMYSCSSDKSYIIKYKYLTSSKCNGDYEKTISTRNPNEFNCNGDETCPYIVVRINNVDSINPNDWRRWFSTTFVVNHCLSDPNSENGGIMYTCLDNTRYQIMKYDNPQCFGIPMNTEIVASDEYMEEDKDGLYQIYCNQADPTAAILSLPDIEDEEIVYGPGEKSRVVSAIETAVCLSGRQDGHHREVGDDMVSYCFNGYDSLGKPTYIGDYGEIRWTQNAGQYGESYGIFLFDQEWAMAYCFSDTPNIAICSKNWYIEHGNTARYYLDINMEMTECECVSHNNYQQEFGDDEIIDSLDLENENNGCYKVDGIIAHLIGIVTWYIYNGF